MSAVPRNTERKRVRGPIQELYGRTGAWIRAGDKWFNNEGERRAVLEKDMAEFAAALAEEDARRVKPFIQPPPRVEIVGTPKTVPDPDTSKARRFPHNRYRDLISLEAHRRGFTYAQVVSEARTHDLCDARHDIMLALYEAFPGLGYMMIGHLFERDHTSAMHGVRKARERKAGAV